MQQAGPIPTELTERLQKAQGHINSAERRLWKETPRGLWSGQQAMARAAEIWLRHQGRLDGLPPAERYLTRERLRERLDALERAAPGTPLEVRVAEIHAAEAAILAEPFGSLPDIARPALEAGLARQYRYLNALRGLVQEVEESLAARYVSLRIGDWARVPGAGLGQLLDRQGLLAWFFVPSFALNAIDRSIRGYSLAFRTLQPLSLGSKSPLGPPAYHWLLVANRRWQKAERMARNGWLTISDFYLDLCSLLDACAKAWLVAVAPLPRQVAWSQVYAQRHVPLLADKAPSAVAEPLIEALQRSEALHLRAISSPGQAPAAWQDEISSILPLVHRGFSAIEDSLQAAVDLAEGEWVEIVGEGPGRIVQRDKQRLVVDLGRLGVLVMKLFETTIQRVTTPVEPGAPHGDEHHRWLWYACHPEACGDRGICPCCGLPGIEAGEPGAGPCLLCGWTHDGDDYDPSRSSSDTSPDLTLDLGRRRLKEVGYADDPPGRAAAWSAPVVQARRQRLVRALDELTLQASDGPDQLEALDGLWLDYLGALASRI